MIDWPIDWPLMVDGTIGLVPRKPADMLVEELP